MPLIGHRLPGRSATRDICGKRFANPHADLNLPAQMLTCTCEPGHEMPHVAHLDDTAVAIAFDEDVERPDEN